LVRHFLFLGDLEASLHPQRQSRPGHAVLKRLLATVRHVDDAKPRRHLTDRYLFDLF
jgi:hypothetical protein